MKKFFILFGFLLFTVPGFSQIRDTLPPWFKLERISFFDMRFKTMTNSLYSSMSFRSNTYWVENINLYRERFLAWEKALVEGRAEGLVAKNMVKSAIEKNPGDGKEALITRHKLYHREILSKVK